MLLEFIVCAQTVTAVPPQPQSPLPVTLAVRFADGRSRFHPGELIPIELEFNSTIQKRFVADGATYDRSGRLTIDEFRVEPIDPVDDPMLDYFTSIGGSLGGGLRGMGVLGEKPFVVKLELNEWFRFATPGTYRLTVRSNRVTDDTQPPGTRRAIPVESNTVSFEIVPADADWETGYIHTAIRVLDEKGFDPDRRKGCRMLRFLATDAAVDQLIARFGADQESGCDFDATVGLFAAPNRQRVVRRMEEGLRAPDQQVTSSYLRTLASLSVYVDHPEFRPAQTAAVKGHIVPSGEIVRHPDLLQAAMTRYETVLAASTPRKSDRARALTAADAVARSTAANGPTALSREQLAASFLSLPPMRQSTLLEYQWSTIAGPAMLPVLRQLAAAQPSNNMPSIPDLALRRLYDLSPEEGRPLILSEIRDPRRNATLATLGRLGDRELPEVDEVLASRIEAGNRVEITILLLHRYGTAAVAARVRSKLGPLVGRLACAPQAAFLAYLLRVDEQHGAELLSQALASRTTTGCFRFALTEIAKLRMTPALESAAIDHLDDSDPDVVISAAEALGSAGSLAAVAPIRARFERWHDTWRDRADEIQFSQAGTRPNARQGMVELRLFEALAKGYGWWTTPGTLRELRALCVSDSCQRQIDMMIRSADDAKITVYRVQDPDGTTIQVGQYFDVRSVAELKRRLTLAPQGASFTLEISPSVVPSTAAAFESDLTAFAAGHGVSVSR